MASITINSNISALTAQRRLGDSTRRLQDSFSRLSSGLRINRASDDAAGLAIASALNTDKRVLAQGVRNLNDGISAASIADSSIESLSTIVIRLQELAEQAANGTIGHKQRASLDAEAQALSKEYFRIARSTEFNDQQLLDGTIGQLRLQGGYGEGGGLVGTLGGTLGTGGFEAATAFTTGIQPYSVTLGDLNGDGVLDLVTADWDSHTASVMLGNGDGSFSARSSFTTGNGPISVTLGDINGDGVLDLVTADSGSSTASVMLGNGDGSFCARSSFTTGVQPISVILGDLNGDGVLDLVTVNGVSNQASVMLGNGDGSFSARSSFTTGNGPSSVTLGDLNGDGVLDLITADWGSNQASVFLATTQSGTAPLLPFSLATMSDARQALPMFKRKLDQLSFQRAEIGVFQSRISVATNKLQVAVENFAAAASQITDADVAEESAHLIKNQILQQAGAAILAQANSEPQLALSLLGGL